MQDMDRENSNRLPPLRPVVDPTSRQSGGEGSATPLRFPSERASVLGVTFRSDVALEAMRQRLFPAPASRSVFSRLTTPFVEAHASSLESRRVRFLRETRRAESQQCQRRGRVCAGELRAFSDDSRTSLQTALSVLADDSSPNKDLSLLHLLGDAECAELAYVLQRVVPISCVDFTGAQLAPSIIPHLLNALRENPSPVIDCNFSGSSLSSREDFLQEAECICVLNRAFRDAVSHMSRCYTSNRIQTAERKERATYAQGWLDEMRACHTRLSTEEFRERRCIQIAFSRAKAWARRITVARADASTLQQLCSNIAEEENTARGAIRHVNGTWWARTLIKAHIGLHRLISAVEADERKQHWRLYCSSWHHARRRQNVRLANEALQRQAIEADERCKRRELISERWAEYECTHGECASEWAQLVKSAIDARLRDDEERRHRQQRHFEEELIAEKQRELALRDFAAKSERLARHCAAIEKEDSRVRAVIEEAEHTIFAAIRCLRKLDEKAAQKRRRLGDAHRMYLALLHELPALVISISEIAKPTSVYAGASAPVQLEPQCTLDLKMDALWPIRLHVLREEVNKLLPVAEHAMDDVTPYASGYLTEVSALYARSGIHDCVWPDVHRQCVAAPFDSTPIIADTSLDIQQVRRKKLVVFSGSLLLHIDPQHSTLGAVQYDGTWQTTTCNDDGSALNIVVPSGCVASDIQSELRHVYYRSTLGVELREARIVPVRVHIVLYVCSWKRYYESYFHHAVPHAARVAKHALLNVFVAPKLIVLPQKRIAPKHDARGGEALLLPMEEIAVNSPPTCSAARICH